jgi:hypothetical protein
MAEFHGITIPMLSRQFYDHVSDLSPPPVICEKPRERGYVKPYITHTSPIQYIVEERAIYIEKLQNFQNCKFLF